MLKYFNTFVRMRDTRTKSSSNSLFKCMYAAALPSNSVGKEKVKERNVHRNSNHHWRRHYLLVIMVYKIFVFSLYCLNDYSQFFFCFFWSISGGWFLFRDQLLARVLLCPLFRDRDLFVSLCLCNSQSILCFMVLCWFGLNLEIWISF